MMTLYLAMGWAVRRPGGGRQWDYSMPVGFTAEHAEIAEKGVIHHRDAENTEKD
jgi:hypothetical protein